MGKPKKIGILGSTGSIGTQTLDVLRQFPDDFEVIGLSAGKNHELLAKQAREFHVPHVFLGDEQAIDLFFDQLRAGNGQYMPADFLAGYDKLTEFVRSLDVDLLVVATVGWAGVEPTIVAIERSIDIALANKEVLVCAGDIVMKKAHEHQVAIWPIDSEHNALMQCMFACSQNSELPDTKNVRRLILTASGGPFRESTPEEIMAATREQTLAHPTWNMGDKITVDSATLMNKGFEVIEAHHLFSIEAERIEVVVHPQSIIHSMIEFIDGSIIAQLGKTDMRLPIQNILTQPHRRENWLEPLDFTTLGSLDFAAPDYEKFPCLKMAFEAMKEGGSVPCALNAANETAVAAHLQNKITNGQIPEMIAKVLEKHRKISEPTLEDLVEVDRVARIRVMKCD